MSDLRHRGRVVVVTGGGSGIGLATARRFAVEGARVTIVGRDKVRLSEAQELIVAETDAQIEVAAGDVTDQRTMELAAESVVAREGGVEVLVNNAGLAAPSTTTDADDFVENLSSRLSIDVLGTAVTTRAFAPHLRPSGSVLNMGSVYAYTSANGSASYSAAKAAIIGLTRAFAVELGPAGIRVNCVSPGWVDVAKWEDYFDAPTLRHLREEFRRVPLRAAVTADEIASVYSFLAHEDAAAISGQDIVVDRGMSADLFVAPTVPGLA